MTTSAGEIVVELNSARAPKTCENFLAYVRDGYYDGTVFHRVIDGFMIQGGGFEPGMKQKTAHTPVTNEADNGLGNKTGTIAMARTPDPHSARAQFFINTNDNDFLDFREKSQDGWGYCVFGRVVAGMDVVAAIEVVATATRGGHQNVPTDDVLVIKVEELGG